LQKLFIQSLMKGKWTKVYSGDLPLRSWWVDSGVNVNIYL